MATSTFKGLSTTGSQFDKNWTKYDIDLIKIDLYNHFNTRVGERVMRPTYGCKIWDYLMEPNTAGMRDLIISEANRVCSSDSRVKIQNTQVYWIDYGIRVELTLKFYPFETVENFSVTFDERQSNQFGI